MLSLSAKDSAVLWLNPESFRIEQFAKTSIRNTKTRVENARFRPVFSHLAQNLFLWTVWDWSVVCGSLSVVTRIANLNGPLTTDKILIAKDRVFGSPVSKIGNGKSKIEDPRTLTLVRTNPQDQIDAKESSENTDETEKNCSWIRKNSA